MTVKPHTLGGRYRLDEPVGSGGMATVWRGYDLRLQRIVAVKLPASHLAGSVQTQQRVTIEAQAVARLTHPNIAAVFDTGRVRSGLRNRLPFLVMEFVEGHSLQTRLRGVQPMHWTTATRICGQIAAALAAAHERGVVHRDVKPDNVMLNRDVVKVVDFGLAALLPIPATSTRIRLGTPEYMAPEQLRGEPVTAAGDVYALGMVLYRLLTGSLPWHATTRRGTIRIRQSTPVIRMPPTSGVPGDVIALCDRCLSNQPEHRPTSRQAADVLRAALMRHDPDQSARTATALPPASSSPTVTPRAAAPPPPEAAPRRPGTRRLLAAGAALAGLALLVHPPWTAPDGLHPAGQSEAAIGDSGCTVRYIAHRTTDAFRAELTLRAPAAAGWALRLLLPPGQHVTAASRVDWTQDDRHLTLTSAATDGNTAAATMFTLTGELTQSDAAGPTAFHLNGVTCRYAVTVYATGPPRPAGNPPADGL
ncbi:serine/threonine-protein kinase [Dactylosporangium aurantiacum]|uniref:serine/threonine-protein kinase n=1 Tax=Dactylosporangium aurantiacum TaxID=35754 RepID=UPI00069322B7|nr:serine/threonine-protein kinase [Dactylosporangium aurantiacum]